MPRLKRIWDVYKSAHIPIMHHICGNIIKIIPYLIELQVDILNPVQHVMPPDVLKNRFGQDIIFFGGIDTQKLMPLGTPAAIKNEVKYYIEVLGEDGKYIAAPDQCLMSDVPIENIIALVNAIRDYAYLPFS